jgi:hemolysin III
MLTLFTSSSLHHAAKSEKDVTEMLRRLDHVAIYIFIAGSYTPYCAISVEGTLGMTVLVLVWGMGLAGAYQKIFFKVRFADNERMIHFQ